MIDKKILKSLTILYVEDDFATRESMYNTLLKLFKDVYIAKDGKDGFELFSSLTKNKLTIDLIISDINMPNMSGLDMVKEIKNIDKNIPFILTTAHAETEYFLDAIKLGVMHYAIKPIIMKELIIQIQDICIRKYQESIIKTKYKENEQYLDIINRVAIVSKTDLNGNIVFVNDIFCQISGYTQEELLGSNQRIVRHRETSKSVFNELWKRLQDGQSWHNKLKNKAKDGSSYFVNANIFPILNENGDEIVEYMSVGFLITEEENKKRKFRKNIIVNIKDQKQKEMQLQLKINNLEKQLRYYSTNDIGMVYDALTSEKEKRLKLNKQLSYYEKELNDSNHKIREAKKEIKEKTADLIYEKKDLNTTIELHKDKAITLQNKLTEQSKKIKRLDNMLDKQAIVIRDLHDVIKHREEQLQNNKSK